MRSQSSEPAATPATVCLCVALVLTILSPVGLARASSDTTISKSSDSPLQTKQATMNFTKLQRDLAESSNTFALHFLRKFPAEAAKKNIVYSPLSLGILLDMILLGAKNESDSTKQLLKTLGHEDLDDHYDPSEPHIALKNFVDDLKKYKSNPELTFSVENLVLTNKETCDLSEEFVNELKKYHEVQMDNFTTAELKEQKTLDQVNGWVKEKTANLIPKLFDKDDLEKADAIFANAAHFKGKWLHTFNPDRTRKDQFYNSGEEKKAKSVDFMMIQNEFGYLDLSDEQTASSLSLPKLNFSVLSLPFSANDGQDMNMMFFLPAKRNGLPELIESMNATILETINKNIVDQQVRVEIPKFTFDAAAPAKEILQSMGLKSIFDDSQDLSKMLKKAQLLKVSNVIHKAKIIVDESGAEAAAATGAVILLRQSLSLTQLEFVADHPFLFIVRHNRLNVPLFVGQVVEL